MTDTSSLPDSLISWQRAGNVMPTGGYLKPLFPTVWFKDAPNATVIFSGLDKALETGRVYLDVLRASHVLAFAAGQDLDDLGAIFGVARFTDEADTAYRVRIPATVRHGSSASTIADMQTYLSTALGVPVTVQDTGPGNFTVTLLGTIPTPSVVMPLVRRVKAAGTIPTAQMLVSVANVQPPRLGTFRLGAKTLGNGGLLIPIT